MSTEKERNDVNVIGVLFKFHMFVKEYQFFFFFETMKNPEKFIEHQKNQNCSDLTLLHAP